MFGLWLLSSVALHLLWERGPLLGKERISRKADNPVEIFHCYLDTLTLFNVMVKDYGSLPARTRCEQSSLKAEWSSIYGWDTNPWSVVYTGGNVRSEEVGVWRYRRYEVWSRCRLSDSRVVARSEALRNLRKIHLEMDELRRMLTRQLHRHTSGPAPLVDKIRRRLTKTFGTLKNRRRLMNKWKNVIPARLRKWGIRRKPKPTCPI
ncbi:MAG: hypothetical protein ABI333_07035 [bacterium]